MPVVYRWNWIQSTRILILFLVRVPARHWSASFAVTPFVFSKEFSFTRSKYQCLDRRHSWAQRRIQDRDKLAMSEINKNENDGPTREGEEETKLIAGWDEGIKDAASELDDPLFGEYCSVMDDFGCEAFEDLAKNLDEKVYRWIRVEAKEDETLKDIETKDAILSKIDEVRSEQEKYGESRLYKRRWSGQESVMDDLSSLKVNGDNSPCFSFSALQFNALAEGLSSGPNAKTPFPVDDDREDGDKGQQKDPGYGGFTQVAFPEICLDFKFRRWRLLEVILGITAIGNGDALANIGDPPGKDGAFDILALEEIDRFRGFFAPLLRIFGYEG